MVFHLLLRGRLQLRAALLSRAVWRVAQLARAEAESVAAAVGLASAFQGTDGPQDLCGEVTDLCKADKASQFIRLIVIRQPRLSAVSVVVATFILTSGISP